MTNLCVLLVDDEEDIRFIVRHLLQMHPNVTKVLEASSLEDAMSKFSSGPPPDFVLTDLNMPLGSGLELIECLRKSGFTGAVALMSGSTRLSCEDVVLLEKPFSYNDVASVVEMALAQTP